MKFSGASILENRRENVKLNVVLSCPHPRIYSSLLSIEPAPGFEPADTVLQTSALLKELTLPPLKFQSHLII